MNSRAGFIWLAQQGVAHGAAFASLRSGGHALRDGEGTNRWVLARGSFVWPNGQDQASGTAQLGIACDGRYRLWLDGICIARGPARSFPHAPGFDVVPLETLTPGEHCLALEIHVPGVDLGWYERARLPWQAAFGDGALWLALAGQPATPGAEPHFHPITDESWRMMPADAWRHDVPRRGWGQDFVEILDGRRLPPGWNGPGFDDRAWPHAQLMRAEPPPLMQARGWGAVEPMPGLQPTPLPPPATWAEQPQRLVWARHRAASGGDDPLRLYRAEPALPDTSGAAALADAARALVGGTSVTIATPPGEDAELLLALPYHAGHVAIEVEALGGEEIDLAVGEALPGEYDGGSPDAGLTCADHLACAQVARFICPPGRHRFERFDWTAVRALQIAVRNAPGGIVLHKVESIATRQPVDFGAARFDCDDPLLVRLWDVARNTVAWCMQDALIDCPGREARQWTGDAAVMAEIGPIAFGQSAAPLVDHALRTMADGARPDGLLRMFGPGDCAIDALTIPDFSLLYILAIEQRWLSGGGEALVADLFPAIERILARFARLADTHGMLCDMPEWHFIEWADIGRSGQAATINALHGGALAAAARLAQALGNTRLAAAWVARSTAIADRLVEGHWDVRRGMLADGPVGDAATTRFSQHANALALKFAMLDPARAGLARAGITDASRLKLTAVPPIVPDGEPFDPASDVVRANAFFAHYVYGGIAAAGGAAWVIDDLRRAYRPMLATGTSTLWESYSPSASLCHGFAATAVVQLVRIVLGLAPLEPGYRRFSLAIEPAGCTRAEGMVPTPHGPIAVQWELRDGQLAGTLEHPAACQPVIAPALARQIRCIAR